jgi:hypothetical protein
VLSALVAVPSLIWECLRFLLFAPSLRRVETLTTDMADHRYAYFVYSVLLESWVGRNVQRLSRRLPRSVVYRLLVVPTMLGCALRRASETVEKWEPLQIAAGVPRRVQFVGVLRSSLRHPWFVPAEYYFYRLHRPEGLALGLRVVHECQILLAMTRLGRLKRVEEGRRAYQSMGDKATFRRFCEDGGLPSAPVVAYLRDGNTDWCAPFTEAPPRDMFVKPIDGSVGTGAARIYRSEETGLYRIEPPAVPLSQMGVTKSYPTEPLTAEALVAALADVSTQVGLLLQTRLTTHDDLAPLVGTSTLTTMRMKTVKRRGEKARVHSAFLRAPVEDSPVDNASAGGILAEIDVETARMNGMATQGAGGKYITHHPVSGIELEGFPVPCFREAIEICERAHELVVEAEEYAMPCVGWDVGITSDGPILIEGNEGPMLVVQAVTRTSLWDDPAYRDAVLSYLAPAVGTHAPLW